MASRGFLRRTQRLPSALCCLVSFSAVPGGRGGFWERVAVPALTFQTLFFGPLTFPSGVQRMTDLWPPRPCRSATDPKTLVPDGDDGVTPLHTHTLFSDRNQADDLLRSVLIQILLSIKARVTMHFILEQRADVKGDFSSFP